MYLIEVFTSIPELSSPLAGLETISPPVHQKQLHIIKCIPEMLKCCVRQQFNNNTKIFSEPPFDLLFFSSESLHPKLFTTQVVNVSYAWRCSCGSLERLRLCKGKKRCFLFKPKFRARARAIFSKSCLLKSARSQLSLEKKIKSKDLFFIVLEPFKVTLLRWTENRGVV